MCFFPSDFKDSFYNLKMHPIVSDQILFQLSQIVLYKYRFF